MPKDLATYLLEARAPLVFRSGKPFGVGARDQAHWPWPSSWAGLMRAQVMQQRGYRSAAASGPFQLSQADQDALLALSARGCFPARQTASKLALYWPRPADAVGFAESKDHPHARLERLLPIEIEHDEATGSDLPPDLLPLRFSGGRSIKEKPQALPAFWSAADYEQWACGSLKQPPATPSIEAETRTHVAIEADTLAAADGKLFQTNGLELGPTRSREGFDTDEWRVLGLGPQGLPEGLVSFGGERRLSVLKHWKGADPLAMPATWAAQFKASVSRFCVSLATPGLFGDGWKPAWLQHSGAGWVGQWPGLELELKLVAARVERWEAISGWDLRLQRPRATRRAAPAGSTYWFEIRDGRFDAHAIWLASMCDHAQDRLDGFGLALPRPWHVD